MDHDSQLQHSYAGEFRHAIDDKNRITIPARWRREGEEFVILPDTEKRFVLIMSPGEFARTIATVENNPAILPQARRVFLRHLHAKAEHGVPDKQGRLVLPVDLCKEFGLKGEIALVGGKGRFEIWNLQKWKRAHEEESATYQQVANAIGL